MAVLQKAPPSVLVYLHHLVTHFPIALSAVAALFVVIGWVRPNESWRAVGQLLTFLAAASGVVAIATGLGSAEHFVEAGGDAQKVALHRTLALGAGALLVLAALFTWRGMRAPGALVARVGGVLTLVTAAAVNVAAHFGGEMIHPGLTPWSSAPHRHSAVTTGDAHVHDDERHHNEAPPSAGSHAGGGGGAPMLGTPVVPSADVVVVPRDARVAPHGSPGHHH